MNEAESKFEETAENGKIGIMFNIQRHHKHKMRDKLCHKRFSTSEITWILLEFYFFFLSFSFVGICRISFNILFAFAFFIFQIALWFEATRDQSRNNEDGIEINKWLSACLSISINAVDVTALNHSTVFLVFFLWIQNLFCFCSTVVIMNQSWWHTRTPTKWQNVHSNVEFEMLIFMH